MFGKEKGSHPASSYLPASAVLQRKSLLAQSSSLRPQQDTAELAPFGSQLGPAPTHVSVHAVKAKQKEAMAEK